MSRIYLLAADRPFPPCDRRELRTKQAGSLAVTIEAGFSAAPLDYYRQAVDELGWPMKPFRHELSLEQDERGLNDLRAYLEQNLSPGECVELWSIWLSGDVNPKSPSRFQGELRDFDLDTLEQFLNAGEICLTINKPST